MMFGRPSLGWAKAKLPARAKPASAEIADRIIAPPGVSARHSVHSSKDAIGASPAERSDASLSFQIGRSRAHEHVDAPHLLAVLRARSQRPRSRRAAEQRDEIAPFQCSVPPVLLTEMIAHLSTAGDYCAAGFLPRFFRSADPRPRRAEGHLFARPPCPQNDPRKPDLFPPVQRASLLCACLW